MPLAAIVAVKYHQEMIAIVRGNAIDSLES